MVKISIVVPVYNVEKYLKKFFLTIQNQTLTDFEVWLVDDGSKDNSLAICNKIKSKDKRFHVIHQSNQGSGVARNVGLKSSIGKYVYFCDPDDSIDKDLLYDNYNLAENTNSNLVIFGHDEEYSDGYIRKKIQPGKGFYETHEEFIDIFPSLFNEGVLFNVWNKLYLRESIDNLEFPNSRIGQDYRFNLKYYKNLSRVAVTPNIYYHYLVSRPGSAQTIKNYDRAKYMVGEAMILEDLLFNEWEKKNNETYDNLVIFSYINAAKEALRSSENMADNKIRKLFLNKVLDNNNIRKYLNYRKINGLKINYDLFVIKNRNFPFVLTLDKYIHQTLK